MLASRQELLSATSIAWPSGAIGALLSTDCKWRHAEPARCGPFSLLRRLQRHWVDAIVLKGCLVLAGVPERTAPESTAAGAFLADAASIRNSIRHRGKRYPVCIIICSRDHAGRQLYPQAVRITRHPLSPSPRISRLLSVRHASHAQQVYS